MLARLRGLWHAVLWSPWERRTLWALRAFTNVTTFLSGLTVFALTAVYFDAETPLKLGACLVGASIVCVVWAIFSSDFIENRMRKRIFGFAYNPNISAPCEWEGYTGPTERAYIKYWRDNYMNPRFQRIWDDPGSGKYGDE